jgi:hypothetical protein
MLCGCEFISTFFSPLKSIISVTGVNKVIAEHFTVLNAQTKEFAPLHKTSL